MYIRFSALLPVATLVAVAAAAPSALETRGDSECDGGSLQCCLTTIKSSDIPPSLAGLLGIVLPVGSSLVGVGCTDVASVNTCTQGPICCNGDTFGGIVTVGCSVVSAKA